MPYARRYVCNGRCQQSPISAAKIGARRLLEADDIAYMKAYEGAHLTPAEQATLNRVTDEAHDVAHILAERDPLKGF